MVLRKHVRDTWARLPVPIPVRVSSCSGTRSGLLYGQIPAAGNQSSQTHNASLSQNIHIPVALRRYILSEGNTPCGCPAARESYPGYFTNKYPLREIKHPAHPHTALNQTYHPPPNTLYPTSSRSGPSRGFLSK